MKKQIHEVEEIMAHHACATRRDAAAYERLDEAHAKLTDDLRAMTIPPPVSWYCRFDWVFIGALLVTLVLDVVIVFLLARGIDAIGGLLEGR